MKTNENTTQRGIPRLYHGLIFQKLLFLHSIVRIYSNSFLAKKIQSPFLRKLINMGFHMQLVFSHERNEVAASFVFSLLLLLEELLSESFGQMTEFSILKAR